MAQSPMTTITRLAFQATRCYGLPSVGTERSSHPHAFPTTDQGLAEENIYKRAMRCQLTST